MAISLAGKPLYIAWIELNKVKRIARDWCASCLSTSWGPFWRSEAIFNF